MGRCNTSIRETNVQSYHCLVLGLQLLKQDHDKGDEALNSHGVMILRTYTQQFERNFMRICTFAAILSIFVFAACFGYFVHQKLFNYKVLDSY